MPIFFLIIPAATVVLEVGAFLVMKECREQEEKRKQGLVDWVDDDEKDAEDAAVAKSIQRSQSLIMSPYEKQLLIQQRQRKRLKEQMEKQQFCALDLEIHDISEGTEELNDTFEAISLEEAVRRLSEDRLRTEGQMLEDDDETDIILLDIAPEDSDLPKSPRQLKQEKYLANQEEMERHRRRISGSTPQESHPQTPPRQLSHREYFELQQQWYQFVVYYNQYHSGSQKGHRRASSPSSQSPVPAPLDTKMYSVNPNIYSVKAQGTHHYKSREQLLGKNSIIQYTPHHRTNSVSRQIVRSPDRHPPIPRYIYCHHEVRC